MIPLLVQEGVWFCYGVALGRQVSVASAYLAIRLYLINAFDIFNSIHFHYSNFVVKLVF